MASAEKSEAKTTESFRDLDVLPGMCLCVVDQAQRRLLFHQLDGKSTGSVTLPSDEPVWCKYSRTSYDKLMRESINIMNPDNGCVLSVLIRDDGSTDAVAVDSKLKALVVPQMPKFTRGSSLFCYGKHFFMCIGPGSSERHGPLLAAWDCSATTQVAHSKWEDWAPAAATQGVHRELWELICTHKDEAVFVKRIEHGDDNYRDLIVLLRFVSLTKRNTWRDVKANLGVHYGHKIQACSSGGLIYFTSKAEFNLTSISPETCNVVRYRFPLPVPEHQTQLECLQAYPQDPTGVYAWWQQSSAYGKRASEPNCVLWRYDLGSPNDKPATVFSCSSWGVLVPQRLTRQSSSMHVVDKYVKPKLPSSILDAIDMFLWPQSPLLFTSSNRKL